VISFKECGGCGSEFAWRGARVCSQSFVETRTDSRGRD
jgi:hypothetical protein